MIRFSFLFILLSIGMTGLFLPTAAHAQLFVPDQEQSMDYQRPETDPMRVAMLYYKFSGQQPDWKAWARFSGAYQKSADYEKIAVEAQKIAEYKKSFSLLTPHETLISHFDAKLLRYNLEYEGYLIDNITSTTFFPVSFHNENFALICKNLLEHQWISVRDMPAKKIDDLRQASPDGQTVKVTFHMVPKYAEKDFTVDFEDHTYKLISCEIKNTAIYDTAGYLIWNSEQENKKNYQTKNNNLLKLYR